MRFVTLVCLLLLAAVQIQSAETRQWLIGKWRHQRAMPMDELTRSFAVHAFLGDVAFVVGGESEVRRLERSGFSVSSWKGFQEDEPLFLAQFNGKIAKEAAQAFLLRKDLQQHLLLDLFEFNIAVLDSDFLENESSSWASKVETISLRMTPIVPVPTFKESPIYSKLANLRKNSIIASIINTISEQNMLVSVYDLSEKFFSRQSASSEIREAQTYLENRFKALGLKPFTHTYRNDYAANVCVDIVGSTNPTALVVTGAHYDSRSVNTSNPSLRAPGAVDNGSGTAGMLEMAKVLMESGASFENTVRICVWTGEEQGLLGSEAYAKKIKAEGANVLAYFNADMTGYQLPNTTITMGMKDRSITEWLLELSYEITALYVPELPVALSASCCSDYISFYNEGYPSIGYFQNAGSASDYPNYHQETDTYEKNNYFQMKLETQAVLAAVLTFAVPIDE